MLKTLAIIGPGSLLGQELLNGLEARSTGLDLRLLSERAAGTEVRFGGSDRIVDELDDDAVGNHPEVAIFVTGAARAQRWVSRFVSAGTRVVDLSSAHRRDPAVPLAGLAPVRGKLIAIPNGASLAAARLVAALFRDAKAPRLSATLLVPVSAAGQAGVRELSTQTAALLSGRGVRPHAFSHRIAFNLVPEVGEPTPDGDTSAESGFRDEVRRLLGRPDLPVAVTAVRVPVFYGLGLVLSGATGGPDSHLALAKTLAGRKDLKPLEGEGVFPMPSLSVGDPSILVGRVRSDGASGFELFATVDPFKLVSEVALSCAL